ncbi:NADAR family protein [Kribbella pittospori]|uniref:NADAR family protein n=1 Tax=Kribbella pittospori TaxID=722689 RepID=UPI003B50C8F6
MGTGQRVKFLFFWGQRDGSVGAGCLSQWWPARFGVDGVSYASAEHYMMAEKARLFGCRDAGEDPGGAEPGGREGAGAEDPGVRSRGVAWAQPPRVRSHAGPFRTRVLGRVPFLGVRSSGG